MRCVVEFSIITFCSLVRILDSCNCLVNVNNGRVVVMGRIDKDYTIEEVDYHQLRPS